MLYVILLGRARLSYYASSLGVFVYDRQSAFADGFPTVPQSYMRVRHTNDRTNLNYQDLLGELSVLGRATSRNIAAKLGKSVKEISNDLIRLKKMGLVKRYLEERLCRLGQRRTCHKGYQYTYCLSKQGQSYLKWMKETKPAEDLAHLNLMNEIAEYLPPERKQAILAYLLKRTTYKYKGPSRRLGSFNNPTAAIAILQSENRSLVEENKELVLDAIRSRIEHQREISELEQKDIKIFLDFWHDLSAIILEGSKTH